MSMLTGTTQPTADPGTTVVAKPAADSRLPGPLLFVNRAFRTLWSNGKARIGIVILTAMILIAIFAPVLAPHSPTATTFTPYEGPNGSNWFGTTGDGNDVFSQIVYGARVSLLVGLVAGAAATLVAVTIGLVAG